MGWGEVEGHGGCWGLRRRRHGPGLVRDRRGGRRKAGATLAARACPVARIVPGEGGGAGERRADPRPNRAQQRRPEAGPGDGSRTTRLPADYRERLEGWEVRSTGGQGERPRSTSCRPSSLAASLEAATGRMVTVTHGLDASQGGIRRAAERGEPGGSPGPSSTSRPPTTRAFAPVRLSPDERLRANTRRNELAEPRLGLPPRTTSESRRST